jgi:hypothetical protein
VSQAIRKERAICLDDPPTPPKTGALSIEVYISRPPVSHRLTETLLASRDRCLLARDRAHDVDMQTYWRQCAAHFETLLGGKPWELSPLPAT